MLKFLLQTVDNKVRHDMCFEMEHAIDYQNWRNPDSMFIEYASLEDIRNGITHIDADEMREYIPVGTIEFVFAFINKYIKENGSKEIKPLNVPETLFKYAGRKIENVELTDSNRCEIYDYIDNNYRTDYIFVKSNDMIKNPINGSYSSIDLYNKELFLNGSYQISEHIDIVSEYRCFIYNDKIVGIQYYSGDFEYFPDVSKIYDFIDEYSYDYGKGSAPQAYTLDILVDGDGFTYVMECHEFFSCGLYGFNDYNVLPYMFVRTFNNIRKRLCS